MNSGLLGQPGGRGDLVPPLFGPFFSYCIQPGQTLHLIEIPEVPAGYSMLRFAFTGRMNEVTSDDWALFSFNNDPNASAFDVNTMFTLNALSPSASGAESVGSVRFLCCGSTAPAGAMTTMIANVFNYCAIPGIPNQGANAFKNVIYDWFTVGSSTRMERGAGGAMYHSADPIRSVQIVSNGASSFTEGSAVAAWVL